MKYRIWTNGKVFKLQRKKLFMWVWLDSTGSWCNWFGKISPKIFGSEKEIMDFIKGSIWTTVREVIRK